MNRSIERLAAFLALSRRHLLEGAMPSRRVPRRAAVERCADDGWDLALALVPMPEPGLAAPRPLRLAALGRPAQPSNENRPSATSFVSG